MSQAVTAATTPHPPLEFSWRTMYCFLPYVDTEPPPCRRITDIPHSGRREARALVPSELWWGGSLNTPYTARSVHASPSLHVLPNPQVLNSQANISRFRYANPTPVPPDNTNACKQHSNPILSPHRHAHATAVVRLLGGSTYGRVKQTCGLDCIHRGQ